MTKIYSFIDKILNRLLSIYLIFRYIYFVYFRNKLKFLENFDRKNLSYNDKNKQDALEKNLNFRSHLFNPKKIRNSFSNFSGNRISILINQLPSFDYIQREEIKTLIIGPRTEGDIYQALLCGIKKENLFKFYEWLNFNSAKKIYPDRKVSSLYFDNQNFTRN